MLVTAQLSLASEPPWLFNQLFSSVVLPAPSHSTVRSDAAVVMTGFSVSSTVMSKLDVLTLLWMSVAV